MGDSKWPSFIIQGIVLATVTTFILKGEGYINTWMFLSLLSVLSLFSLQTTSTAFLYLYPVNNRGEDVSSSRTHILRITTMLSIFFLFMGVYYPNRSHASLFNCGNCGIAVTVLLALYFLIVLPLIFNRFRREDS